MGKGTKDKKNATKINSSEQRPKKQQDNNDEYDAQKKEAKDPLMQQYYELKKLVDGGVDAFMKWALDQAKDKLADNKAEIKTENKAEIKTENKGDTPTSKAPSENAFPTPPESFDDPVPEIEEPPEELPPTPDLADLEADNSSPSASAKPTATPTPSPTSQTASMTALSDTAQPNVAADKTQDNKFDQTVGGGPTEEFPEVPEPPDLDEGPSMNQP
ncbi:MAG: hypothetical protein EPN84_10160 [Legionella sp.]|nr:MAG: hypothetical protein EPN84_10160 [Legionella sp.]